MDREDIIKLAMEAGFNVEQEGAAPMNREDIIRMAREAKCAIWEDGSVSPALERFANLVAEHLCEKRREAWLDWGYRDAMQEKNHGH